MRKAMIPGYFAVSLPIRGNTTEGEIMKLTAVFEKVSEGYIAFVEELPGANTQAETIEQARLDLAEAVDLVLEANRSMSEETLRGRTVTREPMVIATN